MAAPTCGNGRWSRTTEANRTRRLLLNALFFSSAVRSTGPIDQRTEDEEMDYDHGHAHDR